MDQLNIPLVSDAVTCFGINSNDYIFAGTYISGIYRSTDNGETWVHLTNYLFSGSIWSIVFNSSNHIFVSASGSGIIYSPDDGQTWTQKNIGLANLEFLTLCINSADFIFTTPYNAGVFRSVDNGDSWTSVSSGLTDFHIQSFAVNSNDYMFAGSFSGYLFRSINPTTPVEYENDQYPSNHFLSQNYPNPFNPATMISYQIPQAGFVTLKVYDILGREVTILINEEKPAGSYEVQFTASGLTSGIYFYQIKAGEYSETKKMLMIK